MPQTIKLENDSKVLNTVIYSRFISDSEKGGALRWGGLHEKHPYLRFEKKKTLKNISSKSPFTVWHLLFLIKDA